MNYAFGGGITSKYFLAKISDVKFSEKNAPNSAIIRIMVGTKRYYCPRNLSYVYDFELLKAILSEGVNKIDYLKWIELIKYIL